MQLATHLPRSFYARSTVDVARDLLGKRLSVSTPDGTTDAIVVETEAYMGLEDEASHAWRGRTARNAPMFEQPGRLYVYFIYGTHYCVNTVAYRGQPAGAVLLRAVQPWHGLRLMAMRRGLAVDDMPDDLDPATMPDQIPRAWRTLTNGPGKLTQALGIGPQHNGLDLEAGVIDLTQGPASFDVTVEASRRIGIRVSVELPYRFTVRGNPFVSRR